MCSQPTIITVLEGWRDGWISQASDDLGSFKQAMALDGCWNIDNDPAYTLDKTYRETSRVPYDR